MRVLRSSSHLVMILACLTAWQAGCGAEEAATQDDTTDVMDTGDAATEDADPDGADGDPDVAETTEDAAADITPGEVTYHAHIAPIVDAHCAGCHAYGGVAPFAMGGYGEVSTYAHASLASIQRRAMPPWMARPGVRDYRFDPSLSDAQMALFEAWVEGGMVEGDPANRGEPIVLERGGIDRVDLTMPMVDFYVPQSSPDEYRCFVFDWPYEERVYVTGFNLLPGNLAIAHHAVAYLVDPPSAAVVDEASAADPHRSYPCFGGPSPPEVPPFPMKFLAVWTPGMDGQLYPASSGVRVEPGSRVILQMHYSILAEAGGDRSSVEFQVDDAVEREGGYLAWLDLQWPTIESSMLIPAGEPNVTHSYIADPTTAPVLPLFVPGVDFSQGMVLHSVMPHLHKLGREFEVTLERANGDHETLVIIDEWNFDWQREYVFAEPVIAYRGDRLRVTCTWDNSAENQPVIGGERLEPQDVIFGEGTYDEMCVAALYITAND